MRNWKWLWETTYYAMQYKAPSTLAGRSELFARRHFLHFCKRRVNCLWHKMRNFIGHSPLHLAVHHCQTYKVHWELWIHGCQFAREVHTATPDGHVYPSIRLESVVSCCRTAVFIRLKRSSAWLHGCSSLDWGSRGLGRQALPRGRKLLCARRDLPASVDGATPVGSSLDKRWRAHLSLP